MRELIQRQGTGGRESPDHISPAMLHAPPDSSQHPCVTFIYISLRLRAIKEADGIMAPVCIKTGAIKVGGARQRWRPHAGRIREEHRCQISSAAH